MPLNSFLLSIFSKNKFFGANINALATHYHILSIFYIGSSLTFLICLFEIITCTFNTLSCNRYLSTIALLGCILSIICLKKGYRNAAGTIVMIYIHLANLMAGLRFGLPMAAIIGSFSYLSYCYFLTKSTTLVVANNCVTVVEFYCYIKRILKIFEVTLTVEQNAQVLSGIVAIVCVCSLTTLLNFIQKKVECNLWRLLSENYKNSEKLTKEVVQAMNAKDSFVSSLSHEVRNVLNSLNGSVNFLVSVLKDSPHLQILKNAKMSGEILFNLVSNALDAAKLRADKLELSYDHANFEEVIKKAFVINSENLKSRNITARAFIDSHMPKNLWVDSGRMLQILMNLMSNALKFTPRGGQIKVNVQWCAIEDQHLLDPLPDEVLRETHTHIPSVVSVPSIENIDESLLEFSLEEEQVHFNNLTRLQSLSSLEPRGSHRSQTLLFTADNCQIQRVGDSIDTHSKNSFHESGFLKVQVSDTGCGIAKENISKLFDMYIQADHTISSNYGGTGLGLWICKQLCHKMLGDIAVYSQPGIGTKFVFYIPADNIEKNSEGIIMHDKINALVADDYDFNRDLHKLLLEREGVQVTLAKNGLEAVERYKEKGDGYYDFIFMDLSMPLMDGFAATKEIRRWEESKRRKRALIYFVSGEYFNDNEVVEVLKTSGGLSDMTDIKFLRKPIEVEMVAQIIKEHKSKGNQEHHEEPISSL